MNKFLFAALFVAGSVMAAPPPGPYNQSMTYNQNMQFGSTNWYSSPLGQGAAMAGVAIVSGLVNAMSRPDPVVVVQGQGHAQQSQAQPQAQYQSGGQPYYYQEPTNCPTRYINDGSGMPRYVRICD